MKNEHESEINRLIIDWLKDDARLEDHNLEDNIMAVIIPKAAPARKRVRIPNGLIMAGYCFLTLTVLLFCLLNTDLVVFVQIISSGRPNDGYTHYTNLIGAIIALAALCFVGSYWKLKKNVHILW